MTNTTAARPTYTDAATGETLERYATTELQPGMLVSNYGMRLRLGERNQHAHYADAVWFEGTVENIDEIRAQGRDHVTYGLLRGNTWTVQGNHLADWWVIVGA